MFWAICRLDVLIYVLSIDSVSVAGPARDISLKSVSLVCALIGLQQLKIGNLMFP